jgi:CDP-diacylglycerol---glycerol-3-phosphate 3-phosphatidyltransferase
VNLNVPNSITFFRVVLVPVLMAFLLVDMQYGDIFALVVFVLAAASDSLDGYLARRFHQTTTVGMFLDPLADKLIVTAALISLVELGELSAWVAMVVIAREFAVTGLRMVAAAQGTVIPASKWGKAKTASQMIAIAALIIEPRWLNPEWTLAGRTVTWYLVLVMLILTVVSGVDYFVHARRGFQQHIDEQGAGTAASGQTGEVHGIGGTTGPGGEAGATTEEAGPGCKPGAEG